MATHSSILAWEIPWTEEPGGLQSMESQSQTEQKTTAIMMCQTEQKTTAIMMCEMAAPLCP